MMTKLTVTRAIAWRPSSVFRLSVFPMLLAQKRRVLELSLRCRTLRRNPLLELDPDGQRLAIRSDLN